MRLRVTFDTNVLDLACRPERFPKSPIQAEMAKVHYALKSGTIEGYFSITMLTIEGIMRTDRAEVFASTHTNMTARPPKTVKNAALPSAIRALVGAVDLETHPLEAQVIQPKRKPLHPEVMARVTAAKTLGLKALHEVPRIGAYRIEDSVGDLYLDRDPVPGLGAWIDSAHAASRQIEARNLGFAQVQALGQSLTGSDPAIAWFRALERAPDIHKKREVERAFGEWADGDSIASHIAYGLDVFCSSDVGNSSMTNSVLDPFNRAWLSSRYNVRFMTFEELAAALP